MNGLAKILLALGTMLALTSLGGLAIIGAPFLMPALWWAASCSGTWPRAGFTFFAGLVMTEVGWFLTYSATGEDQPYIILGPALGFVLTIAVFLLTMGPRPRRPA